MSRKVGKKMQELRMTLIKQHQKLKQEAQQRLEEEEEEEESKSSSDPPSHPPTHRSHPSEDTISLHPTTTNQPPTLLSFSPSARIDLTRSDSLDDSSAIVPGTPLLLLSSEDVRPHPFTHPPTLLIHPPTHPPR